MFSGTGRIRVSLFLFAPENLVSLEGSGRPVPRQPTYYLHSGWIWCLLAGFLSVSVTTCIHLYRQLPSGQSRVYRVMRSCTDGIHRRESAGTGPVVFKVVRGRGSSSSSITIGPISLHPFFSTPCIGTVIRTIITRADWASIGVLANPARGQLNGKTYFFSVSVHAWEFGLTGRVRPSRPIPRQSAKSPHPDWIWYLLTGFLSATVTTCVHLYRQAPSGQSRVYRVTRLCIDGINCQTSTGTGPVVFKVVWVRGATFSRITV